MKINWIVSLLLVCGMSAYSLCQTIRVVPLDDFEDASAWQVDPWSGAQAVGNVAEHATHGAQAMRIQFSTASVVGYAAALKNIQMNLEGITKIRFSVFNDSPAPVSVAFSLRTKTGNTWFESPMIKINRGQTNIELDMTASVFGKQPDWLNRYELIGTDDITGMAIFVYSGAALSGSVYIDNIRCIIDQAVIDVHRQEERMWETLFSFEDNSHWEASGWSGATAVDFNYKYHTDGIRSLALLTGARAGEQVFAYYFNGTFDFSDFSALRFDIYNEDNTAVQVRINLMTGSSFAWHESKYYSVSDGWNRAVTVPMTDFANAPIDNVTGICIHVITGSSKPGVVYIDNLQGKFRSIAPRTINIRRKIQQTFGI